MRRNEFDRTKKKGSRTIGVRPKCRNSWDGLGERGTETLRVKKLVSRKSWVGTKGKMEDGSRWQTEEPK